MGSWKRCMAPNYTARRRDRHAVNTNRFISGQLPDLVEALRDRVSAVAGGHDDSHVGLDVGEVVHLPVQRRVGCPHCPPAVRADTGADIVWWVQHLSLMAQERVNNVLLRRERCEGERCRRSIHAVTVSPPHPCSHTDTLLTAVVACSTCVFFVFFYMFSSLAADGKAVRKPCDRFVCHCFLCHCMGGHLWRPSLPGTTTFSCAHIFGWKHASLLQAASGKRQKRGIYSGTRFCRFNIHSKASPERTLER